MSRKKIVIKMPSADRADAGEPSSEAMAGSHAEALGGAFGPSGDAESDHWIRAEDVVPLPDDPSARSAPPPRDFTQPCRGTRQSISPRTERSCRFSR